MLHYDETRASCVMEKKESCTKSQTVRVRGGKMTASFVGKFHFSIVNAVEMCKQVLKQRTLIQNLFYPTR